MPYADQKGFGIVESIITALLVSILLLGVSQLYVSNISMRVVDLMEYQVNNAADTQLERLKCLVWDADDGPCGTSTCDSCDSDSVTIAPIISSDCTNCIVEWKANCSAGIWTLETKVSANNYTATRPLELVHGQY